MLSDILIDIAAKEGSRVAVGGTDRELALYYVNKAAQEIWQQNDFEEWMDEAVFNVDVDSQTIAFPEEIGKARAMRYFNDRLPISLEAKRNRYNSQIAGSNEVWSLRWRSRGISALGRNIENASVLKLTIPLANAAAFDVTIIGKNENTSRIVEVVTFQAGVTVEVSTTNIFDEVYSITKSDRTDYDVSIKDVEDNVLAILGNTQSKTQYHIYQILETEDSQAPQQSGVEVLFKRSFEKLVNDTDSFFNTDDYDAAIVARYMSIKTTEEKERIYQRALSLQLIAEIQKDKKIGEKERVDFGRSPWFNLPYNYYSKGGRTL